MNGAVIPQHYLLSEHVLMLPQKIRQRAEVSKADQISLLEATRGDLLAQKLQLEKKIGDLRERQRRKAESDRERAKLMAGASRDVEG
jgi:hypothetical protein